MNEQQWFPGLQPPPKPGKIIVERAKPITVEEKEGMKNGNTNGGDKSIRIELERGKNSDILQKDPAETRKEEEPICKKEEDVSRSKQRKKNRSLLEEAKGSDKWKNWSLYLVKISSSILAALASLMSWYYSFEWFKDKLPGAWRFFLPIIIVGCSVMLPQVALIFLNKKGVKYKGASALVFCVGLLASGFSMLSTIAGIYNANSEAINRKSASIVSAQADTDARAELKRIDDELARLNKEIDSTQEKVDSIPVSDTLKGDSQALMRRLNNAKRSKQDYEAQRAKAQQVIEAARSRGDTERTVREDFNAFLGGQLGVEGGKVEFGMAAAPALLLDIVAPILGAVALFL